MAERGRPPKKRIQPGRAALPEDATVRDVYDLGLKVLAWLLSKNLEPEYRLRVLEMSRKWVQVTPAELGDADKAALEETLAAVKGEAKVTPIR